MDIEATQNIDGNELSRLLVSDLDSRTPLWQRDHVLIQFIARPVRWSSRVGTRIVASITSVSMAQASVQPIYASEVDSRTPLWQSRWPSRVGTRIVASIPPISLLQDSLRPILAIVLTAILAIIGIFMWIQVSRGGFPVLLLIGGGLVATSLALVSKATTRTRSSDGINTLK